MKFGHNLVTIWSRNMILVSNPTKIHTSYSLKLSERPERLRNIHLHWFLLEYIKIMCFSQKCWKSCHVFFLNKS